MILGWNMDPILSDSEREVMLSSYKKFSIYWANYLPFGVELLGHFLNDISNSLREFNSAHETKQVWDKCINLFRYESKIESLYAK